MILRWEYNLTVPKMARKKKIIVVDDEPKILRLVSVKLRVSGYDVVATSDGEEALRLIRSERPDVLLLDIIMPGMDGFDVLEIVRGFSDIPVIVFSARPESSPKAISLGANDFLAKPFDADDLVKRIDTLVRQKC